MKNTQKRILVWPGGKAKLVQHLLPLVKKSKTYVEVFGGAASLMFSKQPNGAQEIYNDLSGDLVTLFRVVKYHPAELVRELKWAINSREEFIVSGEQPGRTDIQRAAAFMFRNQLSFGGDNSSYGVSKKKGGCGTAWKLQSMLKSIPQFHARLNGVGVEHKDWRDLVRVYDSPETFFFFDPPYVGGKLKAYRCWTQEEMAEFSRELRSIKGQWLLTVNDSPANRALFSFGKIRTLSRNRGIANRRASDRQQYRELIVTSASDQ